MTILMLIPNAHHGFPTADSGTSSLELASQIFTGIVGVEVNLGQIGVGNNCQIPIAQNFAEGQTKMKFNGMMHLTFQI